jgi:ABC-type antimicrobial peptide transport system permease subunit
MLKKQVIMAIRSLARQKGYSAINIAGLTIGIANCILILLFVTSELSYDREIKMLILTAAIISWPAAWFLMNRWLDNFAYRIEPGIVIFLAATVITYVIALLTVGLQSWRAANLNPVDVLRNE